MAPQMGIRCYNFFLFWFLKSSYLWETLIDHYCNREEFLVP